MRVFQHWLAPWLGAALLLLVLTPVAPGQVLKIDVTNPSNVDRRDEPVVLAWPDIAGRLPGADPRHLRLQDDGGREKLFQVDDMDGDGTPDELVFAVNIRAKRRGLFVLRQVAAERPLPSEASFHTDAQDWKRVNGVLQSIDDDDGPGLKRDQTLYRFDGVGWESDLIGYRLYLDERNAVDVQGKRKPGLYWKYIGSSDVDYQADADWGMDVLHVGPALGVGGIGFWIGDSVLQPVTLDRRWSRILARGPVRAVVRVDYGGWDLGSEKVDVTSIFTILAGDRITEQRVFLQKGPSSETLATGIVKNDSTTVTWNPDGAWLYTSGRQSRANDSLMLAVVFRPDVLVRQLEGPYDHLVLLQLKRDMPVDLLIASYWQGETGSMWTDSEIKDFLDRAALRLKEPLQIEYQ